MLIFGILRLDYGRANYTRAAIFNRSQTKRQRSAYVSAPVVGCQPITEA